jgi:hypothetical protein
MCIFLQKLLGFGMSGGLSCGLSGGLGGAGTQAINIYNNYTVTQGYAMGGGAGAGASPAWGYAPPQQVLVPTPVGTNTVMPTFSGPVGVAPGYNNYRFATDEMADDFSTMHFQTDDLDSAVHHFKLLDDLQEGSHLDSGSAFGSFSQAKYSTDELALDSVLQPASFV